MALGFYTTLLEGAFHNGMEAHHDITKMEDMDHTSHGRNDW
jgi:hypothetical protein